MKINSTPEVLAQTISIPCNMPPLKLPTPAEILLMIEEGKTATLHKLGTGGLKEHDCWAD